MKNLMKLSKIFLLCIVSMVIINSAFLSEKLLESINSNYGNLNSNTIINSGKSLKLLVKKSIYTSKADFKLIMEMINKTIWGLQDYYSNELYSINYALLKQQQKDKITNLIPLQNYLAKDNEY